MRPQVIFTIAVVLGVGCTGRIGPNSAEDRVDPGITERNPPPRVDLSSCDEAVSVAPSPRLSRLSHKQLANTVRDLLYLTSTPTEPDSFTLDVGEGGFDNNAGRLSISPDLGRDYQRFAETLSSRFADWSIDRLVPCDPSNSDCAAQVVATLGKRAFRRPLSSEEQQGFVDLFGLGPSLIGSGNDFRDGVRLLIEGLLQSPNFLYRIDRSLGLGEVRLDGWETASRLSYALWGTMPDEQLFSAAEAGDLERVEDVRAEVDRMLSDPRAEDMIADFARQLLSLDDYGGQRRDASLNPAWRDDLTDDFAAETTLFFQDVVLAEEGSITDLLTASFTYVNDDTAQIYGDDIVSDPGSDTGGFRRVELDPTHRAGLLTHAGFLSRNADFDDSSPIHRGVFLHRQILCSELPDPPDDVPTELPAPTAELNTNRLRVEAVTSPPECQGCHLLINEPGFAFEQFDTLGQYRSEENGVPVDTSGTLIVDDEEIPFDGAVELASAVANSQAASECYARHAFRFTFGRTETPGDCSTLAAHSERLRSGEMSLRELLVEFVTERSFLYRADPSEGLEP